MADQALAKYVQKAKKKGLQEAELLMLLQVAGWTPEAAIGAIYGDDLVPPAPALLQEKAAVPAAPRVATKATASPVAVVHTLTTRGLEYFIMFIALWGVAFSVGLLLHSLVDQMMGAQAGSLSLSGAPFATTTLLVCLPIFLLLFLRLKKAELLRPQLKQDPSRRRLVQLTLVVSFLFGIGYIISFLYSLLSAPSPYAEAPSVAEQLTHSLVTVMIAGGIFAYYWFDEHRHQEDN